MDKKFILAHEFRASVHYVLPLGVVLSCGSTSWHEHGAEKRHCPHGLEAREREEMGDVMKASGFELKVSTIAE